VFRQIAMNRFEHALHTARRTRASSRSSASASCGPSSQVEMLGDSVEVTEGYRSWWSYVPHFVSTPGYVYAYAYGQLLALSVYRRYEEEGEGFVPAYLDLLRAGGSKSPRSSARSSASTSPTRLLGRGLDLVERQLEAAEDAARDARGVTA
jgi:oligoendopeptidase F